MTSSGFGLGMYVRLNKVKLGSKQNVKTSLPGIISSLKILIYLFRIKASSKILVKLTTDCLLFKGFFCSEHQNDEQFFKSSSQYLLQSN